MVYTEQGVKSQRGLQKIIGVYRFLDRVWRISTEQKRVAFNSVNIAVDSV